MLRGLKQKSILCLNYWILFDLFAISEHWLHSYNLLSSSSSVGIMVLHVLLDTSEVMVADSVLA